MELKELRKLSLDEIYDLYKDKLPTVDGEPIEHTIQKMKYIHNALGFTPNNDQLQAMLEGRFKITLVDSCAGSGKTTISQNLLLEDILVYKIKPDEILGVTFSNKGAEDMTDRFQSLCGKLGLNARVRFSTLHSLYINCLEYNHNAIGLPTFKKESNILDLDNNSSTESLTMLKDTCKNYGIIQTELINKLYSTICYVKDTLAIGKRHIIENLKQFKELKIDYEIFDNVYKSFDAYKKVQNKYDFTDVQELFLRLVKENPNIAEFEFKKQYKRIIIDEAQDTSPIQIEILKHILGDETLLYFIGDRDQSIYAFRGASPKMYDVMKESYPEAKLVTLGYNMRCPNDVIRHAENLLSYNHDRTPKEMIGRDKECSIRAMGFNNLKIMSEMVGQELIDNYRTDYNYRRMSDTCVLYRNNIFAMFLVEYILDNEPTLLFNIKSTNLPYNDKIIKDVISIYYMLLSPNSKELVSKHAHKICSQITSRHRQNLEKGINYETPLYKFKLNVRNKIEYDNDMHIIEELCDKLKANPDIKFKELFSIIYPMYYNAYFEVFSKFVFREESETQAILDYIDSLDDNITIRQFENKMLGYKNKLNEYMRAKLGPVFMTQHGCKGLEYENVYLLNPNDGCNPNKVAMKNLTNQEKIDYLIEEMNLFYVAITRTTKNLTVLYPKGNPSVFCALSGLMEKKDYEKYINMNDTQGTLYHDITNGLLKTSKRKPIVIEMNNNILHANMNNTLQSSMNTSNISNYQESTPTMSLEDRINKLKNKPVINQTYKSMLDDFFSKR